MNRKHRAYLLSLIQLFLVASLVYVSPIHGQSSVSLSVSRVVWGQDPDSPTKAYPGDTETPLTVEVQNLSPDQTIKGVLAVLMLEDGPFTDVYGNRNATATGSPTVGELLNPTDEIAPKGFFTLTFTLDIDSDAVPGTYSYHMIVNYSVQSDGEFVEGAPQNLTVELTVSKIVSTLNVSVSPQVVEKGEALTVSGTIDPIRENATVTFTYKRPDGSRFNNTVRTNADGYFSQSYRPDVEGFWSVNASWLGDETYEEDWASTSFEVRLPVSLSVVTSNSRFTGGLDNSFNMTLTNISQVPVSAIDASLNIPSPLILQGGNQWKFSYLGPGNSTSIPVRIFAPESSIGSTYTGSLDLSYRDDYGESHTESHPIGLIITGRVELVAFGQTVRPQPAKNGSWVEVTTTLLNKGNVPAMYVNASFLPNMILGLTPESKIYVGEIEENSQTPFTLAANVNADAKNGTYPIAIFITYRDDQYVDHSLGTIVYLTVVTSSRSQASPEESEGFLGPFSGVGFVLLTTLAASVAIIILYRRHLSKQQKNLRVSGKAEK